MWRRDDLWNLFPWFQYGMLHAPPGCAHAPRILTPLSQDSWKLRSVCNICAAVMLERSPVCNALLPQGNNPLWFLLTKLAADVHKQPPRYFVSELWNLDRLSLVQRSGKLWETCRSQFTVEGEETSVNGQARCPNSERTVLIPSILNVWDLCCCGLLRNVH